MLIVELCIGSGAGDERREKIYVLQGITPLQCNNSAQLRKGSRSEATRAAQKHGGIVGDLGECVDLRF